MTKKEKIVENDYSSGYNTPVPEEKKGLFAAFLSRLPPEQRSTYDYDLQGAFLAGLNNNSPNGHFSDEFKKPNHPTFSDQSIYNGTIIQGNNASTRLQTARGGKWINVNNKDVFIPSRHNTETHSTGFLRDYFDRVEKENNADVLLSSLFKGY